MSSSKLQCGKSPGNDEALQKRNFNFSNCPLQTLSHLHVVLGSKPPKAARDDYDRFLNLTGSCLGGELPSAELAAASEALWNAIALVPKAGKQERMSAAALLQPYRYC